VRRSVRTSPARAREIEVRPDDAAWAPHGPQGAGGQGLPEAFRRLRRLSSADHGMVGSSTKRAGRRRHEPEARTWAEEKRDRSVSLELSDCVVCVC
jgi:hypothetical protein